MKFKFESSSLFRENRKTVFLWRNEDVNYFDFIATGKTVYKPKDPNHLPELKIKSTKNKYLFVILISLCSEISVS